MSTATPQRSTRATERAPQQPEATLLESILDRTVEYVPFCGKDPIKLSARLVLTHLCVPTASGRVCTQQQAERFIMLCRSRGLNPWEGDAYIVGYDSDKLGPQFALITAHQAHLKRAEVHPQYDGMESGVIVDGELGEAEVEGDVIPKGYTLTGGWARVHLKNRKIPMYRRVALAVFNTGYSRWKKDPAGMICKVAEADALRSAFPNSLGGMYLEGELLQHAAALPDPAPAAPPNGHGTRTDRLAAQLQQRAETLAPAAPAEEEDPPPPADELAYQDALLDWRERLDQCATEDDWRLAGEDLSGTMRARWGDPGYQGLLGVFQEQRRQWEAGQVKPAKRQRQPGE